LTETVQTGDYYSYGTNFFEITSVTQEKEVFGQIDHYVGVTMLGVQARQGQIRFQPLGPIGEEYSDEGAVQEVFVQQRGFEENSLGPTNDKRALQEKGVLDSPITGPAEVSPEGSDSKAGSSFYDES